MTRSVLETSGEVEATLAVGKGLMRATLALQGPVLTQTGQITTFASQDLIVRGVGVRFVTIVQYKCFDFKFIPQLPVWLSGTASHSYMCA